MPFDSHVLTEDLIDFDRYLVESEPGERVRTARSYRDAVVASFQPQLLKFECKLPFAGALVDFRPGEVTVWAGFNGSGKSLLQGQVLADFAMRGQKVCIASFEMKPEKTLARIVRQHAQTASPTDLDIDTILDNIDGRVWLYDQQGTVKPNRMVAVVKHCAEQLGVQHIAIDSLMKCVRGEDDYNGQKDFVDQLTACARDFKVHIHLVHHLKKGEGGDARLPSRLDLRGSAAISDLVDNVLLVWRNKPKERDADLGKPVTSSDPDAVLICDKQRNGDWEGRVKLWFRKQALLFADTQAWG